MRFAVWFRDGDGGDGDEAVCDVIYEMCREPVCTRLWKM